ncbi:sensor histidine kinase [Arthrobacter sp. Sr24]
MRTKDQAGAAERTAASPADLPSAARRADEFTARRRGALRTYFYNHPRVMDVVVVFGYLMAGSGIFLSGDLNVNMSEHVVIVLASATVLMFRRDKPLAVLAIVSVFEVLNIVVVPTAGNIGVGIWFALYSVAVRYKSVVSFALGIVSGLPLMVFILFLYQYPDGLLPEGGPSATASNVISAVVILLSNTVATGIGAAVRSSRKHEAELRQWAVRTSELASVAERNRIAREMHDVVAHSLTVMVALSDGAAVVVKRDPAKAGDVLGQLSQTGRTALTDMRRVLGVLREDADTVRSPQPDHADMGALIEGFRQAGLPILFTQSGPPVPEDPALALTIYRIVQESLTNVLRYGSAVSRVEVMVANSILTGATTVRVRDDGHGTMDVSIGSGSGIVGMRERARIYAGTLDAGPGPQGGWIVTAVLQAAENSQ